MFSVNYEEILTQIDNMDW